VLAFEAVGTSRPVGLTGAEKDDLHAVLTGWAQKTEAATRSCPRASTSSLTGSATIDARDEVPMSDDCQVEVPLIRRRSCRAQRRRKMFSTIVPMIETTTIRPIGMKTVTFFDCQVSVAGR
jgi:hypothetical protein